MLAITPPQRAFVVALLESGARDNSLAAGIAGYGNTEGTRWNAGHRLSRHPKIQAAIKEEADRRLRAGAILAASALIEIAGNAQHKDRFKASVELLNRAGLLVETQHRVIVEDDRRTTREIEEAIVLMAKRNGLDPATLLGSHARTMVVPDVVDAEYTEVDDLSDILGEQQ
jgi:phage terminase small subunit